MRKVLVFICALSIHLIVHAQLSEGGTPPSFLSPKLKSSADINGIQLRKININKLNRQDEKKGITNRYAIYENKSINIKEKGIHTQLNSGSLWQYKVTSENAYSLGIFFSEFYIPSGAKVFIYNSDYSTIYGAFTGNNNKSHKTLAIADFPDNELIIEYYQPDNADFEGELSLGKVGQAYKPGPLPNLKSTNDLHIDVNCEEGDRHQLEKHSVAKMTWVLGDYGYLCTGALINNSENDGTPYFLTANHCISSNTASQTLVTYYNYESTNCGGSESPGTSLSGSKLLTTSVASDVTLLLLDDKPPSSYYPYYAGFNYEDEDSVLYGVGIHHPAGKRKKISIDYDAIYSYPYEINWNDDNSSSPEHSHWQVYFDRGMTEGGSSGSPLFDSTKKIIGQLHGGGANYDFYGKLSTSWSHLQPHLDPTNSTGGKLNGYSPATNPPKSHFHSDFKWVCKDSPVKLKDGSLFSPKSWEWSFTPNSVTFHDGTSSESQNPVVSFLEPTGYTINLKVKNNYGSNLRFRQSYLKAGEDLQVSIFSSLDTLLCPSGFDSFSLIANGGEFQQWFIQDTLGMVSFDSTELQSKILNIRRNDSVSLDGNPSFSVELIGSHGNCSDTARLKFSVRGPVNDDISNATLLEIGESGPYTNQCATVQENEPNPKGGNCNSQINWCDCNVSDILIDNSVWFKFVAPTSGIIGINVPGFDNQIALYDAETAEDILSGDDTKYSIIAANDDYFGEDKDYSALIEKATVTPGKTYWLQVDGSACGANGYFNVELYPNDISTSTSLSLDEPTPIIVYPNFVNDKINISNNYFNGTIEISLINMEGKRVHAFPLENSTMGNTHTLEMPNILPNGIYLISVKGETNQFFQLITVYR